MSVDENNHFYLTLANQISDYVQAHLDEEIVADDLALKVGVSKYHLNRVFCATTGFQLGEFITRRRLQAAHALLAAGNTSVIDASLAAGYQSHSAFSRAFLSAFGCSPSEVKHGGQNSWRTPHTLKKLPQKSSAFNPEIITLPTQLFRGLQGQGFENNSFVALGSVLFSQLDSQLRAAGIDAHAKEKLGAPIGVSLESPWQGDQASCQFFVGFAAINLPPALPLVDYLWVPGSWAKFVHKGAYGTMWQTISRVYAEWIVPEQIRLRDDHIVQVYRNNPTTTAEADLRTELYFPIESKAFFSFG